MWHVSSWWLKLGAVYTKRQRQRRNHSVMTLAILFSLKSMEILENGLQSHSGALLQSCCSIDADAWCKRALTITFLSRLKDLVYLLTVKERFYCALGPAYCEFTYNERPDTMSKFLGSKIIDSNINKFSCNEQFPLHLFTRCRRDSSVHPLCHNEYINCLGT